MEHQKLNVLLLGSGGREHALTWKIAQSPMLNQLFVAPGNGGTGSLATNLPIKETDIPSVIGAIRDHGIHLLVVGPEVPLVMGIRDALEAQADLGHVRIIGPRRAGAQLEGSKAFSKAFMVRHGIPTAAYGSFGSGQLAEAKTFLRSFSPPYVLKADGLAAGKGVLILDDMADAESELDAMLEGGKFGTAGNTVVIEQFLNGIELSVFVLTDGAHYVMLPEAKDYKRIGVGDTGLNTGGMGSISPVPFATEDLMVYIEDHIIRPTVNGLRAEGIPYCGFIFFGLMCSGSKAQVIEYNCRLGDPETESIIPRIQSDLLKLLWDCAAGQLKGSTVETSRETSVTVMLVSEGYPGSYETGYTIDTGMFLQQTNLFHAGTSHKDGVLRTNGGRVMAVNALGKNLETALQLAYERSERVTFKGRYYRNDIGRDLNLK